MRRFTSPAKVNLFLRVLGRRGDGYHLLQSVMTFFPWFDTLEVECVAGGIEVECRPEVTVRMEDNLVYRAAEALRRESGVTLGARMVLNKQVPHGAGLGGGSSNAAVALLALNRMWDVNWPVARLSSLGLRLGADIPFFLGGCSAVVEGIGERLTPWMACPRLELVVVHPGVFLSTREVYEGLGAGLATGDHEASPWLGADGEMVFHNDLEPVACRLAPQINAVRDQLLAHKAQATRMSGSGSAVYGLFAQAAEARDAAMNLSRENPLWRVQQGSSFNRHPFDREWQSGI